MSSCLSTQECAKNETCLSNGIKKTCVPNPTKPPKSDPGTLPTLAPKDVPPEQKTKEWKEASNEVLVLNKKQKDQVLSGRGFITELIVVCIEFFVMIIKAVLALYKLIWNIIFSIISAILLGIFKKGVFGWGEKYRCKNKQRRRKIEEGQTIFVKLKGLQKKAVVIEIKDGGFFEVIFRDGTIETVSSDRIKNIEDIDGTCDCHPKGCGAYTVKRITLIKIITYLFPPYGIFMKKGLSGISEIIVASVLTILLYFPGLMYALSIVDDGESCSTAVTAYTEKTKQGAYQVLEYGDYNMYDYKLSKLNPCFKRDNIDLDDKATTAKNQEDNFKKIKKMNYNTGMAQIYSMNIGSKVKAILYKNPDFTGEIGTFENNVDDLSNLETEECSGSRYPKIKAVSIVLKDPKPLKKVGDYEIIVYEFINYRGAKKSFKLDELTLILKTGDIHSYFDAPELGDLVENVSSVRIGSKVKASLIPSSYIEESSNRAGRDDLPSIGGFSHKDKTKGIELKDYLNNTNYSGEKIEVNQDIPNLFNTKKGNFGLLTMSVYLEKKQ